MEKNTQLHLQKYEPALHFDSLSTDLAHFSLFSFFMVLQLSQVIISGIVHLGKVVFHE